MYEELVKRLRDAAKMSEALAVLLPHSEWNATAKLYKEAADAIEVLSKTEKTTRWIPATEQLPGEMVLAYCRDGEIKILEYSHNKRYWEDDDGYYCVTDYITHWMPLPELPKEGE